METIRCTLCERVVQTGKQVVKFTSTLGTKKKVMPEPCWVNGRHACKEKGYQDSYQPNDRLYQPERS